MEKRSVYLAAPLLAEHSLSMDLYAEDLAGALAKLPSEFVGKLVTPVLPDNISKVHRMFSRMVTYPGKIRRLAKDKRVLLHVLDHSYGHLCRHHPRSIVTCHDIAEYRETALNNRQLNHWKWRVEGLKQALKVIAISNNTKVDLMELLGIPESNIVVAHYGVDPLFKHWQREEIQDRFPELCGPHLKILHIGTNIQRKNLPVLIRALGLLRKRGVDFSFVKVGHDFPAEQQEMIREAGIDGNIVFLGNRKAEDLPKIYSLCDIFVFPSTYEGFGRPILEAQACGTPVILAESSCLPEVGGDGALYFPPQDEEALADRILELQDPSARERLATKGFANAALYTWRAHAEKVIGTYRSIP